MHLDYNDPVQWLAHRFACDAEARSTEIEQQFLDFFAQHTSALRLVDVGSGTGANFRYYYERIPHAQTWTLIEQDRQLVATCRDRLRQFADERGYAWEEQNETISITKPGQEALVTVRQGNLEHIEQLADLGQTDVVTANAVFDLLSLDQFDTLVARLAQHRVALLATLNYYETSFLPFSEEDARFVQLYHTHMQRPQAFGTAMGADCSEEMLDTLRQHRMVPTQGSSQWHLKQHHTTVHHFLLHFVETAVGELNLRTEEQQDFDRWLQSKRALSDRRELEVIVDHSDIFAYPE